MKNFNAGIIGCGTIFPMHARSLKNIKGVKLAAVSDIKEDRAKKAGKTYGCNYYTDYKKMLDREHLDTVHICTPHYLHMPMILEAAKRKINVITEKPMGLNPLQAEKEIKAARRTGITFSVISQNRFNPGSQLVKKRIEDGSLGRLKAAKLVLTYHKPDSYYKKSDWKGRKNKEGGGVVIDQAIHYLDIVRWLIPSPVDYVEANVSDRMHSFIDVEDTAEGVVKFKNGFYLSFYLINCYSFDDDPFIDMDCAKARVRIVKDSAYIGYYKIGEDKGEEGIIREGGGKRIIGEDGEKRIIGEDGGKKIIREDGGKKIIREDGGKKIIREEKAEPRDDEYIDYGNGVRDYWGYCHYNQIRDFYDALRRDRKPAITGEDALKTQKLVWAIYESSRRNRRVYL